VLVLAGGGRSPSERVSVCRIPCQQGILQGKLYCGEHLGVRGAGRGIDKDTVPYLFASSIVFATQRRIHITAILPPRIGGSNKYAFVGSRYLTRKIGANHRTVASVWRRLRISPGWSRV
jgi:hypothetical protein